MKASLYLLAALLMLGACERPDDDTDVDSDSDSTTGDSGSKADCEGGDVASGAILEVIALPCSWEDEAKLIIRTQEDLESAFDGCDAELPKVDFNKYMLLGATTGASGCTRRYLRNVDVDEDALQVAYSITIIECGGCEPWEMSHNLVKIPSLSFDYNVSFDIDRRIIAD